MSEKIHNAFQERFFLLHKGQLAYYKSAKDAESAIEGHFAALECAGMCVSRIAEPELVRRAGAEQAHLLFHVQAGASDKERLLECACASEEERDRWCEQPRQLCAGKLKLLVHSCRRRISNKHSYAHMV
jgi:hypothetical protein